MKLLVIGMLFLAACSAVDFSKVKPGMTESQVVAAIGAPSNKTDLFTGVTWWKYGDTVVVMDHGKVERVVQNAVKVSQEAQAVLKQGIMK